MYYHRIDLYLMRGHYVRKQRVYLIVFSLVNSSSYYHFLIHRTDSEDSEVEDVLAPVNFDVTLIDHFDLSKISSLELLNENRRRLIWMAKVRLNQQISFSIIIKDYLPDNDIDAFQEYRLNEFNGLSQHQSHGSREEFSYEFSSRTRLEYDHESRLLLNELKNHPFIVHTFICNHNLKRGLRIFMEYLPSGNLYTYLTQSNSNSSDLLSNEFHLIYQLAQVMAYLSNKKIVHRDLATRNILFQNEQHIKLSDFGLSRFAGEILEGSNWTVPPRWTAPECFDRSQKISSSSDVWSFGIVIWEIYSFGAQPYETETITNNHSQQLVRLLKRFLIEQNRRLSRPDYCSESMYDLMCRCWNGNIEKRPRFVDIIDDFNGRSIIKDRIIPFSRDEKNAWKNAKEKYLTISTPVSTPSTGDGEYVEVEDNETDDTTLF
jgi:serine/threonine protein kinase